MSCKKYAVPWRYRDLVGVSNISLPMMSIFVIGKTDTKFGLLAACNEALPTRRVDILYFGYNNFFVAAVQPGLR